VRQKLILSYVFLGFIPVLLADEISVPLLGLAKGPAEYWIGTGWTGSGDFAGAADFDRAVAEWAQRVAHPLVVEVGKSLAVGR